MDLICSKLEFVLMQSLVTYILAKSTNGVNPTESEESFQNMAPFMKANSKIGNSMVSADNSQAQLITGQSDGGRMISSMVMHTFLSTAGSLRKAYMSWTHSRQMA
jgi:hypothetical protein